MIGRRWNLPLLFLLSVNSNLGVNRPFAIVTVLAIAGEAEIELVAGSAGVL